MDTKSSSPAHSYILFELGATFYGIPSERVQQMEIIDQITPVPKSLPFVEGIVMCRGQVIPVISLRIRFGLPKIPQTPRTRLIVVNNDARTVGLLVDSAREFISIPTHLIQLPPERISGLTGQYLAGIAQLEQRLILIIDIEELLNIPDMSEPSIAVD